VISDPNVLSLRERNQHVPQKRIFAVDPERARPADSVERSGTGSVIVLIPSSPRPPLSPLDLPSLPASSAGADGRRAWRGGGLPSLPASSIGGRSSAAAGRNEADGGWSMARGGVDRGRRRRGGEGRPSVLAARTAGASGAVAGEVPLIQAMVETKPLGQLLLIP
jgi:hypothetical protein